MVIHLTPEKAIHQLQLEFSRRYPFLRLEFSRPRDGKLNEAAGELNPFTLLRNAGLNREGELVIEDSMSVKQLEKAFYQDFGLLAHVSRRSGLLWIQTTLTNNWTLQKQNDHGQEISLALNPYPGKAAGK